MHHKSHNRGGLCPGGSLPRGGLCQGDTPRVTSGRYASYWNAFLCYSSFRLYSKYFTALFTKPAAESFPASTGTIPVEWIKSLKAVNGGTASEDQKIPWLCD